MGDGDILDLTDDELLALPRPPCPGCGTRGTLVPRIYGMPAPDDPLMERVERQEVDVEFAGCIIPLDPLPVWRCRHCDALVAEDGAMIEERTYEE
jgi:hypothetical protein